VQFVYPSTVNIFNNLLYVADQNNHRIQAFDLNGNFIKKWGLSGSEPGRFNNP